MTMPTFYNPVPGYGPEKTADTFGPDVRPGGHTGWDFRSPMRTPVKPSAPGRIYQIVGENTACGLGVRIDFGDGWTGTVCHLDELAPGIAVGVEVDYQTVLGWSGQTGNAIYPHVHASWEHNGVRQDPDQVLEGEGWIRPGWSDSQPDDIAAFIKDLQASLRRHDFAPPGTPVGDGTWNDEWRAALNKMIKAVKEASDD